MTDHVIVCGRAFAHSRLDATTEAELDRLNAALPHLVRRSTDGTWWIGTTVVGGRSNKGAAPFPEQEARMRRICGMLPPQVADHPSLLPFGLHEVAAPAH